MKHLLFCILALPVMFFGGITGVIATEYQPVAVVADATFEEAYNRFLADEVGFVSFTTATGRQVLLTHGDSQGYTPLAPTALLEQADLVVACYPFSVAARTGKATAGDWDTPSRVTYWLGMLWVQSDPTAVSPLP
jgi:hypothetical protein